MTVNIELHKMTAAPTPGSEQARAYSEHCRGDNLLLLLNLPFTSRVLIIGDRLLSWRGAFRNSNFYDSFSTSSTIYEAPDLVLYHSGSTLSYTELVANLRSLRIIIAAEGSLLVFADNYFSHVNLKKIRDGKVFEVLSKTPCGYLGYSKLLNTIGFQRIQGFVPMPCLEDAEELWSFGSRLMEIPHYLHPLLHLVHKLGCFRFIADGYIFLAAPSHIEGSSVFQAIEEVLPGVSGSFSASYELERVDFRLRGAMVLFILDVTTQMRFVARVVSDLKIADIVGKNQTFLSFLQSSADVPQEMKHLIPSPIRQLNHANSVIYIETMLAGIPAWKANGLRLKRRILDESVEFIVALNRATKQISLLHDTEIAQLFAEDLSMLKACNVMDVPFLEKMLELAEKLKIFLHQRELFLVVTHGDYGYGNILVDAGSGKLTGVIDWDTGKRKDLAGVDLFNFYVQKERVEKHHGVFEAFKGVVSRYISRNPGKKLECYLDEFMLKGDLNKIVLYLGFVRYMARSAQYPAVFQREQKEYQATYEFMLDLMPI